MTTVNFDEVKAVMLNLKRLRAEVDTGNWSRRELCIQMHEDLCEKLFPLFEELAEMDLLVLFTKPEGDKPADVSMLEVDGINGGIQLTKKVYPEEDNEGEAGEGEGIVLTEVTDPNDPAFDPRPDMRTFSFEF